VATCSDLGEDATSEVDLVLDEVELQATHLRFGRKLERTRGVAALGHWWSICFGTKELVPLFCLQACEHMGVEDVEV